MLSSGFLPRLLVAAILACATTASLAQGAGQLPAGDDFAALAGEARARRTPIMIAFIQETCPYCAVAKRDHLVPMHLDAAMRDRVIIREVDIDGQAELRDFNGTPVRPKDFSRRYRVALVPTVVVVNERGELLAAPLVGISVGDFYGFYLERALEEALAKMRAPAGPGGVETAPR